MNSKTLTFLLVAALVYLIFVIAHQRFDRPLDPDDNEVVDELDVSDLLRPLLTKGREAFPAVRAEIAKRDDGSAALLRCLPAPGEAWLTRLDGLLSEPPVPPYGRVELAISEPRGVEVLSRPAILLRREQPGSAWLRLFQVDGERLADFEVPVNQRVGLPDGIECRTGATYRLELRESKTSDLIDSSEFEVLDAKQLQELQEAMQTLKRYVGDQRLRFYLQACCAMSRGLHAEATEILLKRMPRPELEQLEVGLIERLTFLYDRRAESVHRDRLLKVLASLDD